MLVGLVKGVLAGSEKSESAELLINGSIGLVTGVWGVYW